MASPTQVHNIDTQRRLLAGAMRGGRSAYHVAIDPALRRALEQGEAALHQQMMRAATTHDDMVDALGHGWQPTVTQIHSKYIKARLEHAGYRVDNVLQSTIGITVTFIDGRQLHAGIADSLIDLLTGPSCEGWRIENGYQRAPSPGDAPHQPANPNPQIDMVVSLASAGVLSVDEVNMMVRDLMFDANNGGVL